MAWITKKGTREMNANELADCFGYASRLAICIWEKHYKESSLDWKSSDTLMGVLLQIDNMTVGLSRVKRLTDEEITNLFRSSSDHIEFARAILRKAQEK